MELKLKNFETVLSKDLLQSARKCTVRECDETEKGNFVGYVDEGKSSYDVSLELTGDTVTAHGCDCKASTGGAFCRHQAAMLLHIAAGQKPKAPVKAKKAGKAEILLEEAETAELKEWLREILGRNKDLELSFVHYFSARRQHYSPEEVTQLTLDAVKATVGRKKTVDPTLLKKLVDLWSDIHAPILSGYTANAADKNAFGNVHALLETAYRYSAEINTTSSRIPKYLEGLLQQTLEPLHQLEAEEAWTAATDHFIRHLLDDRKQLRLHYLQHLRQLAALATRERREDLIRRLADHYRDRNPAMIVQDTTYTKVLFGLVEEAGIFPRYYNLFQPLRFDNAFNNELIRQLIAYHHLERAEEYCLDQIKNNYHDDYNTLYLELLKEIYHLQEEEELLMEVLAKLVPRTFDLDDFLYVLHRLPPVDQANWRTQVLTKARNTWGSLQKKAIAFRFQLMDHEQDYSKMVSSIDHNTPYRLVLQYFEPMARADKSGLLKMVLNKYESSNWSQLPEESKQDQECFPDLLSSFLEYFTPRQLWEAIAANEKARYGYRPNAFLDYLKENLYED
ncbi:hypothetical protein V9K67_14130 [Paraflavisolibacter sp. H34]|uniref:hypothetical protein n=1 Tax=Huijunlia imazamoxiresistens TaxID=3127457 RepID=UPI003015ABB9